MTLSARLRPHLGGLPSAFWWLWGGTLANRLGNFVHPFLALFLTQSRGYSVVDSGLVLTSFGLGAAVSQPVGGALADQIGRRATMVLSLTTAAAALMAVGLARSLPALCLAVGVYGLCLDLYRPAVQAAVADLVPDVDRPRAYGLNFWAVNLGFSIAVPLGGVLADRGYWTLFLLDAATSLVFAGLILRRVPETRPAPVNGAPAGRLSEVLADRLLLALVGCVVLHDTIYRQAMTTLPLVVEADGLGSSGYGFALGLNGVLIVALQPLLLGVLSRARRDRLLLLASLLQGGGFALHGLASTVPEHMGAVAVWTVGEVLQAGLLASVVASLAPARLRGRYMGVFGGAFGIAAFVAPLAGTQLLFRGGESALSAASLVGGIVAGIGLARVSRRATARALRLNEAREQAG